MASMLVLVLSIVIQTAAAALAVRLIWLTGRRWAWGLVAAAILLMIVRRCIPLAGALGVGAPHTFDLPSELVALAVSVLMLLGIGGMEPVFRAMRDAARSLRESQRRLEHLNAVLRGIRNIGQIVAKEKDRQRLLHQVCDNLIESRGYRHAWIAALRDGRRLAAVAEAGLGESSQALRESIQGSEMPRCLRRVLESAEVRILGEEIAACADCAVCRLHGNGRTMAVRLGFGDELFGVMVASLATGSRVEADDRSLFREVAEDISFALHGLRLEQQRQRTEKNLRLDESRLEALLQLNQIAAATFQEITNFALEEAVRLTESKIGYLAFVNAEETELTMHAWSKTALDQCQVADKPIVYQVAEVGLWGEAVRQRKPVITNDYAAPNPAKKGCPVGHLHVTRHMNVPVFDGGRIVLVAGVGNKNEPYSESDIRQLTLLMQGMWQIIQRRRADEEVRRARDLLETRVRERTAELAGAHETLRTSETKYRTLYDSSRDAIVILTPGGNFLSGNPAAIALFGCRDEEEFTSLAPADLSPPRQPGGELSTVAAQRMMALAVEKGSYFFDWVHKQRRGREFFASVLLTRMELESRTMLQATIRDITEEKRAEEALRAAKDAAEAANRAKSTFLATMSHEIRTPLNAIIGMTELVLDTPLSPHQRDFLATVKDSGEALLAVINDILDFSRIEAGRLELDHAAFDLREVLGDTMRSLALRAHKQGLELVCHVAPDAPGVVVGDPSRLRQIVVNLVGNALKFTEQGEVVLDTRVQAREQDNVTLHLSVRDTGVGIAEEKQSAIFHPFEQVDGALTRRHAGSGLGLAISARLVQQMGGRIWVDSRLGAGSTFHFTARFGLADDQPGPSRRPDLAAIFGLRVLAVDDNATNRRILEEMLTGWGMLPVTAACAREALQQIRQAQADGNPFRLVLSDAHMPEIDGFSLAGQIARQPGIANVAVIMLTSGDHPEDAKRCEQCGIAAYLLKPVKQSELFDAIVRSLGLEGGREEPAPAPPDATEQRPGPWNILLAEDSVVNQNLARVLLERHGHTVVVVGNGREAVAAVQSQPFDLVLMDVQMPEMDGLEATALIRAEEKQTGGHVPIVAMTAHALKGDRERCLAAGMDAYISKPIHATEVYETLDRLLGP